MLINKHVNFIAIMLGLLVSSCAIEQPVKPINSELTTKNLLAKDPNSPVFIQYLVGQGYAEDQLPFTEWGIDELTLCALFYHTKLDVAKQELALSDLAVETAGIRNNPSVDGTFARSGRENGDISPWSYGLSVNIPIETTKKRAAQIEKAEKNTEVAHMNAAETAWQLRNQIAIDYIAYHQNLTEMQLLQQEIVIQHNIINMLEKRVNVGLASTTELSNANLLALKARHAHKTKQEQLNLVKARLAADVGLSPEKFAQIKLKPLAIENTLSQQSQQLSAPLESKTLQEQALLNRIDIRRSIARYAAAEAEIKLKIAQQTPDIVLSPGYLFEFGDRIWSLGFSSLLNMLHKNKTLLEEAKQLREIEGAQFENLQAEIIAKISQAHIGYLATKQETEHAESELEQQLALEQKMQKQFNAGLIGKFDLSRHASNVLVAKQQLITSQFALLQMANQIEDVMQKPLYSTFNMPTLYTKRQNDNE
jgi:cobalt-zinc-cadmium efflux system outer membrane protein